MPPFWRIAAASGALLFLAFAVCSFVLQGVVLAEAGDAGDVAPEEVARMVSAREREMALAGFAAALAGVGVGAFALAWREALGPAFPRLGVVAGAWWGGLWMVAGALQHAAVDLSGHFAHPAGAKAVLAAASIVMVSPAGVLPAVVLVGCVAWAARRAGLPRWFVVLSWVAFGLVALGVLGFASYTSGAVGLAFLPVWLVAASVVLLRRVVRAGADPGGGAAGGS